MAGVLAVRLDEFVASRVVEAAGRVRGQPGRRGGRPADLAGDDLAWVRAASGRGPTHPDPRLPLIG